jgi:hypothetical protein
MGGWYELLEDGRTRPTSDGRPSPLGDDAVIARDEVAGLWSTTTVSTVFCLQLSRVASAACAAPSVEVTT